MKMNFGKIDREWEKYGLHQAHVDYNGEPSKYKAIIQNDDLITLVKKGYKLFPNEEALRIAGEAAKLAGLNAFSMQTPGVTTKENVVYYNGLARMRAFYAIEGRHDIEGDEMNVGIQIYNSIDGSSSFGLGLFTFRFMCGNGVIMGKKDIASIRKVHKSGLQTVIDDLKDNMVLMMERAIDVVTAYRQMAEVQASTDLIKKLRDSPLSKKVLPDYVTEEEAELPDLSEWDVYNDVTQEIWHNPSGMNSKVWYFNSLHRLMPIAVRRFA